MDALEVLMTQYDAGSIIFLIVVSIIVIHFVGTSLEWVLGKIKTWFHISDSKERRYQSIAESIEQLKEQNALVREEMKEQNSSIRESIREQKDSIKSNSRSIEGFNERFDVFEEKYDENLDKLKEKMDDIALNHKKDLDGIKERMQEETRAHIIERHHHFCYELGCIDDSSLQILEIMFSYYRSHGGNSYIEKLIKDVEELPRINAENVKTINNNVT